MNVYVFDKEFELLGIVDTSNSFTWNRKHYDCGTFELHLPLNEYNLKIFKKGNIICKADNLSEAGYITYRKLIETDKGEEKLLVKGNFLLGLVGKRIVWDETVFDDSADKCIVKLVEENCINPINKNRKIPNLYFGSIASSDKHLNYSVDTHVKIPKELNSICTAAELSTHIRLDPEEKKMYFEVVCGLDRTINQNVNPCAVFSKEYDNVTKQEYTQSDKNYCNTALYGNETLGIIGDEYTGLARNEVFINTSSVDEAQNKLNDFKQIETFEGVVNAYGNLIYRVDYDLGDKVTFVSKKWNVTIDVQITEIKEIYEDKHVKIECTFGDSVPTLIDVLKMK